MKYYNKFWRANIFHYIIQFAWTIILWEMLQKLCWENESHVDIYYGIRAFFPSWHLLLALLAQKIYPARCFVALLVLIYNVSVMLLCNLILSIKKMFTLLTQIPQLQLELVCSIWVTAWPDSHKEGSKGNWAFRDNAGKFCHIVLCSETMCNWLLTLMESVQQ